jgi:peptidoglycan-N-acetylglucosamine deacetylase
VSAPHRKSPPRGRRHRAVYRRRRAVALLALGLLLAVPVWLVARSGGGEHRRRAGLTAEERAALRDAGTVVSALDRVVFGGPMAPEDDQRRAVERFIALGRPVYCGGLRGRYLALTFDDGPGDQTTAVLRTLRAAGQRATFFILGKQILEEPAMPQLQRAAGAVGDHSFSHAQLPPLNDRDLEREIVHTQDLLQRSSGGPVRLFRPPFGLRNPKIDRMLREHGMLDVLWNVDTEDGRSAGPAAIYRLAVEGMRPGSIILMHESAPNTLDVLPRILAELRRRGLQSVSVPELLALQPPTDQQVRAGGMGCSVSRDPVPGAGSRVG